MATPPTAQLQELLSRWRERRQRGEPFCLEELCHDMPAVLDELRRQDVFTPGDLEDAAERAAAAEANLPPTELFDKRRDPSFPVIAGFDIVDRIGHGGMGIVYKARQISLGRFVAIKLIRADLLARPDMEQRFRREAETVARLYHPNIVHVYDIGTSAGTPFLSMEYVDGGSLAQRIKDGARVPRDFAVALVRTLAEALQHVHDRGIVHRDLKPGNILLTADGVAKIVDFGLAKLFVDQPTLSDSSPIAGTPAYMAPEQAAGRTKDIGPATDVHALGAILYELLVGTPPFRGDNALAILHEVQYSWPIPLRELRADVPRALEELCLQCLAKEPLQRVPNAGALAHALTNLLPAVTDTAAPVADAPVHEQADIELTTMEFQPDAAGDRVIAVEVVEGNVLSCPADVLALGVARRPSAAALQAAELLQARGQIEQQLRRGSAEATGAGGVEGVQELAAAGNFLILPAAPALAARHVLFAGVGEGYEEDVFRFTFQLAAVLAKELPDVGHLVVASLCGDSSPDDEAKALSHAVEGFREAARAGKMPPRLQRIAFVEPAALRHARMKQSMLALAPSGNLLVRGSPALPSARNGPPPLAAPATPRVLAILPAGELFDDLYHYAIEAALRQKGYECHRATEMLDKETLRRRVRAADLVLIDASVADPLCCIGLGLAWALPRPTLVLTRESAANGLQLPPDQRLSYTGIRDLEEKLKAHLAQFDRARRT